MTFDNFDQAAPTIQDWRDNEQRIVFTNGCFDILHYGHISYLLEARSLGDKLILGLNSDESIQRLKGPSRPIKDFQSRSQIISHLDMIDMVIIFETETPLDLITKCRPDILVKGGDYTIDQIVGADIVLANGGDVKTLNFEPGYSSSSIIDKIQKL